MDGWRSQTNGGAQWRSQGEHGLQTALGRIDASFVETDKCSGPESATVNVNIISFFDDRIYMKAIFLHLQYYTLQRLFHLCMRSVYGGQSSETGLSHCPSMHPHAPPGFWFPSGPVSTRCERCKAEQLSRPSCMSPAQGLCLQDEIILMYHVHLVLICQVHYPASIANYSYT